MVTKRKPRKMPAEVKRELKQKRKTAKRAPRKTAKPKPAPVEAPGVSTADQARRIGLNDLLRELGPVRVNIVNTVGDGFELPPEAAEQIMRDVHRACRDDFGNLANFGGLPHIPSKEEAEAEADDSMVDDFNAAMQERMAQKRAAGYSGWNDPTRCDARKLARQMLAKLFGTADLVDLGNYAGMLFHFGDSGEYALRVEVAEKLKQINRDLETARKSLDANREESARALANERARAERAEANLARALGYIDRVTEGDGPLPMAVASAVSETRTRGPNIDLGTPAHSMSDFLHRR